jgi:hypothetical protein
MQSSFRSFSPSKEARALERGCIVANKGAQCPIFEGNMLPQEMYPFFVRQAVNKKARAFEQSCTVSQDGAIGLIFEEDMPP